MWIVSINSIKMTKGWDKFGIEDQHQNVSHKNLIEFVVPKIFSLSKESMRQREREREREREKVCVHRDNVYVDRDNVYVHRDNVWIHRVNVYVDRDNVCKHRENVYVNMNVEIEKTRIKNICTFILCGHV